MFRITLLLVCLACLMSCNNDENNDIPNTILDDWPPLAINYFNQTTTKEGGEVVFEVTNYDSWAIIGVTTQKGNQPPEIIYVGHSPIYHIAKDWFSLNIPSDKPNSIYCSVKENLSDENRTISISVTVGGKSIDIITVTQE